MKETGDFISEDGASSGLRRWQKPCFNASFSTPNATFDKGGISSEGKLERWLDRLTADKRRFSA